MNPLDQIEWSAKPLFPPVSDPAQEKAVKKALKFLPGSAPYFFPLPWLSETNILMTGYTASHLPGDLARLTFFVVVQDHACRYCYGTNRTLLKLMGYTEEKIQKIEGDLQGSHLSAREIAALEFARKLSKCNPRPVQADFQALQQLGFSQEAITELSVVVAMGSIIPRMQTFVGTPPDPIEDMAKHKLVQLFRPVVGWLLRMNQPKPRQDPFPANNPDPFSDIIAALKGVPAAAAMFRKILDEAWSSPVLPKRSKALVFAIVAKTLNCPTCEAEGCRLLELEGLPKAEVQQVMTYLSSSQLAPFEAKLAQLARDTVRYQTGPIQRKFQEFSQGLSREVMLEVIGITALANGLARLSILLGRC